MNNTDIKPNEPFDAEKEKYEYEILKQKEDYAKYKEQVPLNYKNSNNTSQSSINVNK